MDEYIYLIGSGPEAERIIALAHKRMMDARKAWQRLVEAWGAESLLTQTGIRGTRPTGLAFTAQQNVPWLKSMGRTEGWYTYTGNRRFAQGRKLCRELASEALVDDGREWLVNELGLSRMVRSGNRMLSSVAGWKDGLVLASVPSAPIPAGWQGDPIPVPPAWMREVTREEWNRAWNGNEETESPRP